MENGSRWLQGGCCSISGFSPWFLPANNMYVDWIRYGRGRCYVFSDGGSCNTKGSPTHGNQSIAEIIRIGEVRKSVPSRCSGRQMVFFF